MSESKILIVDDTESSRYVKSRILRQAGFVVREVLCGREALQLVKQEGADLVILDVNLPDINGFEVCRRIKTDPATASTLVLHASATFVEGKDRAQGLEGGADAYLVEPILPEELIATVRALLRLRQAEEALREANTALHKANDELGLRVQERTRELVQTNELLRAEIASHKQAEETIRALNLTLERRVLEQEALYQLAHNLIHSTDLPTIGAHFFTQAATLFGAEYGDLMIVDDSTMELRGIAAYGRGIADFDQERVDMRKESAGAVLAARQKQVVVIKDYTQSPLVSERLQHKYYFLRDTCSVPLVSGEKTVGIFSVGYLTPREVQTEDLQLLQVLGHEAALAIEHVRLTQELQESERLAALGTSAAKLAHEISNPLNGISTTVQLVERYLARQTIMADGMITAAMQDIAHEVNHLRVLLQEFRSLARPSPLTLEPTDLAAVVEESLMREVPVYTRHGIQVEHDCPAELPRVLADRRKLKQALLNLYKNATEAMPQGGTLTVNVFHTDGQIVIQVTDTGEGVPQGVDIFKLFTTTKLQGTGLGLAIVHQIITDHGGTITYTSEPGQGTTFTLTLPVALPSATQFSSSEC